VEPEYAKIGETPNGARQAMAEKETGPEKPDRFFSQIGRRP
jgi:hypothetical protein